MDQMILKTLLIILLTFYQVTLMQIFFNQTLSYKTIHTQYEKNSQLRQKENSIIKFKKKKKKINLELYPPIKENNHEQTYNEVNQMYDTIDYNNTFINMSSTYYKSEESNILLHKIKRKENSNVVDFLAMDSINIDIKNFIIYYNNII